MNIDNYDDINIIKEYLIDLKDVNDFDYSSFALIDGITHDFLMSDLYLYLNNDNTIVIEIVLTDKSYYFEWLYSIEYFKELRDNIYINYGDTAFTENEELIMFRKLLECISFKHPSKHIMAKKYNLK